MDFTEITFEKLPEAVAFVIKEIEAIKIMLNGIPRHQPEKKYPIEIEEASKIIRKAKSTIYALVHKGEIPCYKSGKKLYFYEDELLSWIAEGKRKSTLEIKSEIEREMLKGIRNKPARLK